MAEYLAPGVYVDEMPNGATPIEGVDTSTCAILGRARRGAQEHAAVVTSLAEFEARFGSHGLESPLSCSVRAFFANGGRRALIVRIALTRFDAGLRALENERFGLLVLAPPQHGRRWANAHWAAAAELCERQRAFLVVDPPFSWQRVDEVERAQLGLESPNSAAYFPHLLERTASGGQRTVAPAGAVAGIYARTDAARGVWKAPAGVEATIVGALGVTTVLTDRDEDALKPTGVNTLRVFPGQGLVVWGARTLSNDPEWKYVPVRRFGLFLAASLERGLAWTVFEPNAEPLWNRVRDSVTNFMLAQWRAGALQGAKPEHAFYVKCDATTLGALMVGFAPLKPAEFVVLHLQFATSGA